MTWHARGQVICEGPLQTTLNGKEQCDSPRFLSCVVACACG